MRISFDRFKRARTLAERGLDFEQADLVFAGRHFTLSDDRREYGESRFLTFGFLRERPVVLVWTPRGDDERRIISMRHAHDREIARAADRLERPR